MTYTNLTDKQALESIRGASISTELSIAVHKAECLAEKSGCEMTVVSTIEQAYVIFSEFKMLVAKDAIVEKIFSTKDGFLFPAVEAAA